MKNAILCFALLFIAAGIFAQTEALQNPAVEAAEALSQRYQLDTRQQAEMLKIQERTQRNLSEIKPLEQTNPALYIQKIRSLQYANEKSYERILRKEQLQIFRQDQIALREKKARVTKEMKEAGSSPQEIEYKMAELDLEVLQ